MNHFYRSVLDALEFDGPALICCYTTCQPEHGVADNMATDQARLAVDTRAFPLVIHDPRKGDSLRDRISLQGNPAVNEDWWTNPKTGQVVDFIDFARSEGRFVKHFDKEGNPSPTLLMARQDRLENWHLLQDLAGLRAPKKPAAAAEKPAAKPAAKAPKADKPAAEPAATNGHAQGTRANGDVAVGTRIKYHDGAAWIAGVVESLEPAVLALEDKSIIRTTREVLLKGVAEGLIVRQ
ncbi:MAG: hypothetical protein HY000_06730 [Planctomycetes bacterium]|nr:hypothetical protein [Planctomycetota bacterium]